MTSTGSGATDGDETSATVAAAAQPNEVDLSYPEAVQLSFRLHREGRLKDAEILYRALLKSRTENANIVHYLGVLLLQTGRGPEGLGLIERSLAIDPAVAAWHNNYGNGLLDALRYDDAAAAYQRCTELDPDNVEVLSNLGILYRSLKRYEDSVTVLQRALAARPDFLNARVCLSTTFLAMNRIDDAFGQTIEVLKHHAKDAGTLRLLGHLYGQVGRMDEAARTYREWLDIEPDNEIARHHLAACSGEGVPDQASGSYVEAVFDRFAGTFDAKLQQLDYRAPQFTGEAVARWLGDVRKDRRILDAGCGTGLCSPYLAPFAKTLAGVDLSANMMELARKRGLYDELTKADLVAHLESVSTPFDLIVSADTLCYFGRLEPAVRAARNALCDAGLLIFTVEARSEGGDYHLHPHGRYSHRAGYVHSALEQAGFAVREITEVVLRSEAGHPVQGLLVVGQAVAAPT